MSILFDLLNFIQHRMRISHIYQPVTLTTLIKGGGTRNILPANARWWEQQ